MKTLYTVLKYNDDTQQWEVALETYDEKEAVVLHRRLRKQGINAIID